MEIQTRHPLIELALSPIFVPVPWEKYGDWIEPVAGSKGETHQLWVENRFSGQKYTLVLNRDTLREIASDLTSLGRFLNIKYPNAYPYERQMLTASHEVARLRVLLYSMIGNIEKDQKGTLHTFAGFAFADTL